MPSRQCRGATSECIRQDLPRHQQLGNGPMIKPTMSVKMMCINSSSVSLFTDTLPCI